MNRTSFRNLIAALLALAVTAVTTETIVQAAPRPYVASMAPHPQVPPAGAVPLALCAGRSGTVC